MDRKASFRGLKEKKQTNMYMYVFFFFFEWLTPERGGRECVWVHWG